MSQTELERAIMAGRVALNQGEFDRAEELFRKVADAAPDLTTGHEGFANALYRSGRFKDALAPLVRLTQLDPKEARHFVNLAAAHLLLGELPKAIEVLQKAIQRDKKNSRAYFNLGVAYRLMKQQSMAINAFKEACKCDPQYLDALLSLGDLYLAAKNRMMASTTFKKALELDPENRRARFGLDSADLSESNSAKVQFERLMETPVPLTTRAAPKLGRVLSIEEKIEDRTVVHQLAADIERGARALREITADTIEPLLHELQKYVADGSEPHRLGETFSKFLMASERWLDLRKHLRRKMLELKSHEELLLGGNVQFDQPNS